MNLRVFVPWPCLCAILTIVAPASARSLDLPVRDPRNLTPASRVAAPAYAGDVLELRLAAGPARLATARLGTRVSAEPLRASRLGVAALDALASETPGLWFEPMFRNEKAPEIGSTAPDLTAFYVVHLPPGLALEHALDRFASLAEVVSATPIAIVRAMAAPNDSLYPTSYWYRQPSRRDIHAEEAWNLTTGDTSIVVAIADSGVLPYHPDLGGTTLGLSGQIWTNWVERGGLAGVDDDGNGYVDDVHGWDFVSLVSSTDAENGEDWQDADNDPNDFASHGTEVAGLVGAMTNNVHGVAGTAWNVRLMPLRLGWAYPGAPLGAAETRMDFVAEAIHYATRMGANVINYSFESVNDPAAGAAVDEAIRAGVVVVVSGGTTDPAFDFFARREDVISVSVTDATDLLATYSNFAPYMDLAAPGVGLASTALIHLGADSLSLRTPTYRPNLNGSSFSAPLVSGAAAVMLAHNRANGFEPLDPRTVLLRLRETTDDIADVNPGSLGLYGTGRLNAYRALTETTGSTALPAGGKSIGSPLVMTTLPLQSIAYVTDSGRLVVLVDSPYQDTLAVATLGGTPARGPAAANLGGGRGVGIFVGLTNGTMVGLDTAGHPLPGWPRIVSPPTSLIGGPALGDLDGDGTLEVVCGTANGRIYAWHDDGSPVPGFPVTPSGAAIRAPIALSNLDGSPGVDIVAADQGGDVWVFDATGNVLPGWPVTLGGLPGAPCIGPSGASGATTVWIAAGNELHAIDPNGLERPGFPAALTGTATAGQDVPLADLDLDGSVEAIVVTTSPNAIEVRDSLGTSVTALHWPRALPATGGSPVVGDFASNPAPELLLYSGTSLLALTNAADSLGTFPEPGGAGLFPSLGDVDGDERYEVAAGTGPDSVFYVYDTRTISGGTAALAWPTYRGNAARTGSTFYAPPIFFPDTSPPSAVADLRAGSVSATNVQLRWTAPIDAGSLFNYAASYDVRISNAPIDETNFASATPVAGPPTPGAPGATDSLLVTGLVLGQTYYFSLKSRDFSSNLSTISNVLGVTTVASAPAQVADLAVTAVGDTSVTLRWTAVGEDGTTGRPQTYLVHASEVVMDDVVFPLAPFMRDHAATVDAGGAEAMVFGGLQPAHRYWFGIKALDASNNLSVLSNVISVVTGVGGPLAGHVGIALAPQTRPSRVPTRLFWQAAPGGENGAQSITIYDLQGRTQMKFDLAAGLGGVIEWNGRDAEGNRAPAGLYFARLSSGSLHTQTRVVLLP